MKNLMVPIGTLCVCSLFIGCSQENLIFFPETLPQGYRFSYPIPFEEVSVPVEGATLNALLFRTRLRGADLKSVPGAAKGVILYLHGNAGSLRSWGDVAPDFVSRGYDILIPDYRGFGKSTGQIANEKQLLDDGMALYRTLTKTWPEGQIIVYGRSIGTGVATFIARSARPGMLILESPFLSLIELASHHYPFLPKAILSMFLRYPLRNDQWIGEVSCPVYLFHGTRDEIIPFNHSVRLEGLIRSPHRLIRIEGGSHNNLSDFGAFDRELDRILR